MNVVRLSQRCLLAFPSDIDRFSVPEIQYLNNGEVIVIKTEIENPHNRYIGYRIWVHKRYAAVSAWLSDKVKSRSVQGGYDVSEYGCKGYWGTVPHEGFTE